MASETLAKIDRAYDVVSALCEGKREWFMSLPARPDHDPDLIIGEALLAASNEISRLTRELQALRRIVVDLHWMARRYVDGRTSYATRLFNDHTRALVALGVELNRTSDGTIWARDGMGRAYDGLSEEEAAQGEPAPAWLHEEDWKAARAHARRLCVALRAIRYEAAISAPPLESRREQWEAALREADEVLGELEALYGERHETPRP